VRERQAHAVDRDVRDGRSLEVGHRPTTASSVCFTPSRCEQVELEALKDGVDLRETISRARFEELCLDLFKKTMAPVTQVLRP